MTWAIHAGVPEVVTLMLDHGANLKPDKGYPPLLLAVQLGNVEIVRLLIKGGADVNFSNDRNERPLHAALRLRKRKAEHAEEIITILKDAGAHDNPDTPPAVSRATRPSIQERNSLAHRVA